MELRKYTLQQKNMIEAAKTVLRSRKLHKNEDFASLEEVIEFLPESERLNKRNYLLPDFVAELHEALRRNPKLRFDETKRQFRFEHRFEDANDLVNKLYREKIGVEEDLDLFDDIKTQEIESLKQMGLLRGVEVQKKSRGANNKQTFLFTRNYANDPIEQERIEESTTQFLRDKWAEIDKETVDTDKYRRSGLQYINKQQAADPKAGTTEKRKRLTMQEERLTSWKNDHILGSILKAFADLEEMNKSAPGKR